MAFILVNEDRDTYIASNDVYYLHKIVSDSLPLFSKVFFVVVVVVCFQSSVMHMHFTAFLTVTLSLLSDLLFCLQPMS